MPCAAWRRYSGIVGTIEERNKEMSRRNALNNPKCGDLFCAAGYVFKITARTPQTVSAMIDFGRVIPSRECTIDYWRNWCKRVGAIQVVN